MKPKIVSRRSLVPVGLIFSLFLAAVVGAWGWFNVNPRRFPTSHRLEAKRIVAGYVFTEAVLDRESMDTLAISTNSTVFGTFARVTAARASGADEQVSVFFAEWGAHSAKEMSVVQHTPDVCWQNAGAVSLPLGQPSKVELRFDQASLRFECRVFEFSNGVRELTLWCTLLSGQVFEEPVRFSPPQSATVQTVQDDAANARAYSAVRRLAGGQFLNAVRRRVPGTGEKQFVRFSTVMAGNDWSAALVRLQNFGAQWLRLEITQPAVTAAAERRAAHLTPPKSSPSDY